MTEYTVKEIGHQWMVYADRKLIIEDSAAKSARRKAIIPDIGESKGPPA